MNRQEKTFESSCHCISCQKYYKISTLAEMFDMSIKTIRRRIADGKIQIVRIQGQIRIPHSEVIKSVIDIK